ncbi:solute carrier family 2 member 9, like 1 [Eucyclogobius newberryi]|uniref:solute carrier family 2 member 9, like 1 n=1 Tax=Eucyclogobius newberryi TaxID=166745 RepID=UPI003B59E265
MIWSVIVSIFSLGGLLGVLSARLMSSKLGRKKTLYCSSFISIAGAIVILTSKMLESFEMVIAGRVLFGFSAGLGTCINLMYLGDMSLRKSRGMVTFTATTFTCFGKLSAQFFGLSEILGREELWNVLLCVSACLSVVSIVLLPFFPEAPRYLFIEKGDDQACKRALQSLWGPGDYKEEMEEMLVEQAAIETAPPKNPLQLLRSKRSGWALFTICLICLCNQMSGFSTVSTFSYDIFYKAGMPEDSIRYVTLALGVIESITSICCGFLMENIGRRPLVWVGYGVMAVSWALVSVTVYFQDSAHWVPYFTALFIVTVIVFFWGGPGGGVNTLNTEIFIQSERMAAVVLVGIQRWVTHAVIGLAFPFLIATLGSYCYVLFACWCLVGGLYSFFILPETKGKSVLEISEEFRAISMCRRSTTADKDTHVETVF